MRSYFFSADTQEDMLGWVRALSQSAAMEPDSSMNRYHSVSCGYEVLCNETITLCSETEPIFFFFVTSFQALLKLSGFHTDRWQHWISGFPQVSFWWRGAFPKTQACQQDSQRTESFDRWEDGDVALRAEGEAESASEEQQVVKLFHWVKGTRSS